MGTLSGMSPKEREPEATGFARAIADALAGVIEHRGISKRELARKVGRSNNYVAMRFRHEAAFTLTDVDAICDVLGLDAGSFIAGASLPHNVTQLPRVRGVALVEDLDAAASETEDTRADDRTDEGFD